MGVIPIIPTKPFSNSIPTPELGPGISDDTGDSLRNPPSAVKRRSYQDEKQIATRGIIAPKDFQNITDEVLFFQYNPAEIQDVKTTEWVNKSYIGFSASDYMWVKGGERIISFKLFFDATASTIPTTHRSGQDAVDNLQSLFPRGIMPMVEKLTKYLYPMPDDPNAPLYSSYGIIPTTRFNPPSLAILVFGDLYLEGIVADVSVAYTLFNKDLQPIRGECQVKFKVLESSIVAKDKRLNIKRTQQL